MLSVEKIKKPSFFTVLFFLVMITLPMTVNAGPPVKCPCFSENKVIRLADRNTVPSCQISTYGWNLQGNHDYGYDGFIATYNESNSGNNYCSYSYAYTKGNKHREGHVYAFNPELTPDEAAVCLSILNNICGP